MDPIPQQTSSPAADLATPSKAKPTPGPWSTDSGSPANPAGHVWSDKRLIASCAGHADYHANTPEINTANAAYIVRACNAHDAVVEAADVLFAHHRISKAMKGETTSMTVTDTLLDRLRGLRAALELAKK